MPPPHSAGILLFRQGAGAIEVLLIKPGGPFWRNKDAGAWMIPKGLVEPDETPAEAALRELREETGLVCSPDRLVALGTCLPEASTLEARVALFAAMDCTRSTKTEASEIGLGGWVSFSMKEAERLLVEMSLEEVTTLVSLHRFFLMKAAGRAGF